MHALAHPPTPRRLRAGLPALFALLVALVSVIPALSHPETARAAGMSFQTPVGYTTGSQPVASAVGDFNGDGYADVAVANAGDDTVSVLLNCATTTTAPCHGPGSFKPAPGGPFDVHDATSTPVGQRSLPSSLNAADMNHDGILDLVLTLRNAKSWLVLQGRGDGFFSRASGSPSSLGVDLADAALVDFSLDGMPEPVFATGTDRLVTTLPTCIIRSGVGVCSATNVNEFGTTDLIVAGDFNSDGIRDVAVGLNYPGFSGAIDILLGSVNGDLVRAQGSPFVLPLVPTTTQSGAVTSLAVWDFDKDGKLDLVVGQSGDSGWVSTYRNTGGGNFTPVAHKDIGVQNPRLAVADFNRDGFADVLVGHGSTLAPGATNAEVLQDSGNGQLDLDRVALPIASPISSVVKGDFDKDGFPDVAVTLPNSDQLVAALSGQPVPEQPPVPSGIITVSQVDFSTLPPPFPIPNGVAFKYRWVPVNDQSGYFTFVAGSAASQGSYTPAEANFVYSALSYCTMLDLSNIKSYFPPENQSTTLFGAFANPGAFGSLSVDQQQLGAVAWLPPQCVHWYLDAPLAYDVFTQRLASTANDPTINTSIEVTNGLLQKVVNLSVNNLLGNLCDTGCTINHNDTLLRLAPYNLISQYLPNLDLIGNIDRANQASEVTFGDTQKSVAFMAAGCGSGEYMVLNPNPAYLPAGVSPVTILNGVGIPITAGVLQCITIPQTCTSATSRLYGDQASFHNWINYLMDPIGFAGCAYSRVSQVSGVGTINFISQDIINAGFLEKIPALFFEPPGAFIGLSGNTASPAVPREQRHATTTSVVSAASASAQRGQMVTYQVSVSTVGGGQLAGTVTFTDNGAAIATCTAQPIGTNGVATCETTLLVEGPHLIQAGYAGDEQFAASSSPGALRLIVGPATLTIRANDKSMTYGGAVPTFDASFSGFVGGETSSLVSGLSCGALDANGVPISSATAAGSYTITCGGASAPGYTISYQPGTLTISPAQLGVTVHSVTRQYSDPNPLFTLDVTPASATVSGAPNCTTTATTSSPAGSYPITCDLSGMSAANYTLPPSASGTLTVVQENTATEYTGDQYVLTAGPKTTSAQVQLAAKLTQEADGSAGDLTKAQVVFALYKSSNAGSTPDLTFGPFAVDANGVAQVPTLVTLAADTWTVKVTIPTNNQYWLANPVGISTLSVVVGDTTRRVTGGGWVADSASANGKSNFGLTVAPDKNGTPKGTMVFVTQGTNGFTYVVKNTSWQGGGLTFFQDPSKARFSGKAAIQQIDASGNVVAAQGNASFTVELFDGDLLSPRQTDRYGITIKTSSGTIWKQLVLMPLGGGNVAVKSK